MKDSFFLSSFLKSDGAIENVILFGNSNNSVQYVPNSAIPQLLCLALFPPLL